ncbi:FRG domain-containing protein [uncultured Desulfobacter sp.]|uniref:FRG domain-containing protein n=1 Tax=uncultured Desulfobacter sp. TaxID=240139 RepID=UPI0029F51DCA|nr:FRG domain-containing protein [uncultured Desulfobacter sp.]
MKKYLIEDKRDCSKLYRVTTIEAFIELATWMSSDGRILFRGQRSQLPLIPSVGRDKDSKLWLSSEREVFDEFKREALPYLGHTPNNDWQWLAVAQHNRLPTRLLDWTRNPLAALWFAVCKPAIDALPGIVWSFSYGVERVISNTLNQPSPFSIEETFLYCPEHVFPYIQAQSGVFTIHHRDKNSNEFVSLENTKDADLLLRKIEIPSESFSTLRYKLFRLGINASSLFPGLHGLVERIKYQNELGKDELEYKKPLNKANSSDAKKPRG